MASIVIDTNAWPVRELLSTLLLDRTTKKNIIFATESYADRGAEYRAKNPITENLLGTADGCIIQPRVLKDLDEQQLRTRKKAEVFTPAWVCCMMINHLDEDWFGRPDVFGKLEGQEWSVQEEPVALPKRRRRQTYIDSRRLEITCGEVPYLVSRYDKVRVRHILQKQVYGMAPTRIIYLIATNYILGFDESLKEETHNFALADAADASKNGTLAELVDRHFG